MSYKLPTYGVLEVSVLTSSLSKVPSGRDTSSSSRKSSLKNHKSGLGGCQELMSVIDDFIQRENFCYPSSNLSATDELLIVLSFCSILSPPSGTRPNHVQVDISY